ncbi:MAG: ABC transporter substrate binding protein [Holosporaceae bacterium]
MFRPYFYCLSLAFQLSGCAVFATKHIGVVVPATHPAMSAIVAGLCERLPTQDYQVTVQNAQGDAMLQQQIIQQMKMRRLDAILPIGTQTSLMTLAQIKDTPVVCVAAAFQTAQKAHPQQKVAVINDEISSVSVLRFLKACRPDLQTVGILYGNSEKNVPDIESAKAFCKKHKLKLCLRKVDTLAEVHLNAETLAKEVQVIIVLKDHLVVSGIASLITAAQKAGTLLFAMDDGSVSAGAPLGLGVLEKEIGHTAADVLQKMLVAPSSQKVRQVTMKKLHVFYNPKAFQTQSFLTFEQVEKVAKEQNFHLTPITARETP